jgi:hypothetical protein
MSREEGTPKRFPRTTFTHMLRTEETLQISFFQEYAKGVHNFIERRGLSTRTPPLVASNKRSNNSTPASPKIATPTKQQHNMKELVQSYTTKPHLDRRRTPPKNSNSKRTLLADAPSKEEIWWNSVGPEKASSWTRQQWRALRP